MSAWESRRSHMIPLSQDWERAGVRVEGGANRADLPLIRLRLGSAGPRQVFAAFSPVERGNLVLLTA